MINCGLCGTELGQISATHLRGPKCDNPEELTVAQYLDRFPGHASSIGRTKGATSRPELEPSKDRPATTAKSAEKRLEKVLGKFDEQLVRDAIDEIAARIDADTAKLNQFKILLEHMQGN